MCGSVGAWSMAILLVIIAHSLLIALGESGVRSPVQEEISSGVQAITSGVQAITSGVQDTASRYVHMVMHMRGETIR